MQNKCWLHRKFGRGEGSFTHVDDRTVCEVACNRGELFGKVISGGTDNHSMLIDLRTKFPELTGKKAENTLVKADITINKNMVPFDTRTPFSTSGLRVGTPAITTRGLKEEHMALVVDMIDRVLSAPDDETVIAQVKKEVNAMMSDRPMFAW